MKTYSKIITTFVLLAMMLSFMGVSHAATSPVHLSSIPNTISISTSHAPELYQENVSLISNLSGRVLVTVNSSNIFLSLKSFNITSGVPYVFNFSVNATSTSVYSITFNESNSLLRLPIHVNDTTVLNSPENYSIITQGTISPYSQIVLSVTENGRLVQTGELIISYDNVTQSINLSTNPFPTISFGNVYGFVKIYYYSADGTLLSELIQNAGGTASSFLQPVALSCPSLSSKTSVLNISSFTLFPQTNINCVLYDPSDFSIVTGVNIVAIQNGQIYLPNPAALAQGELSIAAPPTGWQIGNLLLTLKSNKYKLTPTLMNVIQQQNPTEFSFINGSAINSQTINALSFRVIPNANLQLSIKYPNGSLINENISQPTTISSTPGTINITTSSYEYAPKTLLLTLNQTPLIIKANTTESSIYTYTPYIFTVYSNGAQIPFDGPIHIGNSVISFSGGTAAAIIYSANSTVVPSNGYTATLSQVILPRTISLEFLDGSIPVSSMSANTIYTVESISNGTVIPITANITLTSSDVNYTIPLKAGIGYFSPPSQGIYRLQLTAQGIQPLSETIKVGPALIGGLSDTNILEIAIVIIIIIALILYFTKIKKNSYEFMEGAAPLGQM